MTPLTKEDPLHRLSRTSTTASRQQQISVWKKAEDGRTKDPHWKSPLKPSTSPSPHYAHDGHASHATAHSPTRLHYVTSTTTPKKKTPLKMSAKAEAASDDVQAGGN
jgi:hypothetical protein